MVNALTPIAAGPAITVSDLKTLRQLADSGQLKAWQAGAVLDVVVKRREAGLLMLDTGKGLIGLPVPDSAALKPGMALQIQVLALQPLQLQLRPAPLPATTAGGKAAVPLPAGPAGSQSTTSPLLAAPLLPAAVPFSGVGNSPIAASLPEGNAASAFGTGQPTTSVARELANLLRPLLSSSSGQSPSLHDLPARLSEWLGRLPPSVSTDAGAELLRSPATSIELPRLAQTLLSQWPNSQQVAEPDQLENLLRQALFAQPTNTTAGSTASAGTQTSTADWLGQLARLLFALPSLASKSADSGTLLPGNPLPAEGRSVERTVRTAAESAQPLPPQSLPLPEELLEELASVLGRQQQHWLNNLQADPRQQPWHAELLLRHGERLDPFELSVRADDSKAETDRESVHHVVRLRFDLPGLGVCQFLLDLAQDDLQLHFYSERAETLALFDAHVDNLAGILAADAIHLTAVQRHHVETLPALRDPTEQGFHVRA